MRRFAHGVGIEHKGRQVHKAVRLRLALERVGVGLLAACGVGAAVLEEAVLQFLGRRLFEPASTPFSAGMLMPYLRVRYSATRVLRNIIPPVPSVSAWNISTAMRFL